MSDTCVFTYGVFSPPTSTHLDIFDRVQASAQKLNADSLIFIIEDSEHDWNSTVKYIEMLHDINICGERDVQDIVQACEWLGSRKYRNIVCLVDSAQVSTIQEGLDAYNEDGTIFSFSSIRVVSIGSPMLSQELRDNSSGDAANNSLLDNNFEGFQKALGPRISPNIAARIFTELRKDSVEV